MRTKDKPVEIQFDLTLTNSQQEIWDAAFEKNVKYVVCNLSRQQGKTTVAECILIKWLFQKSENIIYITPQKDLARQIYNYIKDTLEPQGLIRSYNSISLELKSITTSRLKFFSAEQMDAIRGNSCTKMIIDEAAFIRNKNGIDVFNNIIFPVCKVKCEKLIMISTPNGKQGFFYDFAERAISDKTGHFKYIKKTIYEDGIISNEDLENYKKLYTNLAWRQEYLCEFLDNALTVFVGFDKQFKNISFDESRNCWFGVDLSANGEDDTVLTKVNDIGQVKCIPIKGTLDTKYQKIAEIINNQKKLVSCYIEKNGVGAPIINEIKKLTKYKSKIVEWLTTNSTKNDEVNMLCLLIDKEEIIFEKADNVLFSQLSTFERKVSKSGGYTIIYSARDGFHDDYVMSLLLAIQAKHDVSVYSIAQNTFFIKSKKI